jgi:hypothetical protein
MKTLSKTALLLGAALALAACPAKLPGGTMPGGGGGKVGPDACGSIDASDVGRKIHAFLEATVMLQEQTAELENQTKKLCVAMGQELGMSGLDGDTGKVCNAVANEIKAGLGASLKAEAKFVVKYKPAVCHVSMDAAISAQAKCEGKAEADVKATCEGSCSGTCNGACAGTCKAKNADGSCNGECVGTCNGSCSGECNGSAHASGSAECQATAEAHANLEAKCDPPELDIQYDAKLVVDKGRLDKTIAAIQKGLPGLLALWAKANGPFTVAVTTFAHTAADLAGSAQQIASAFGNAAVCVAGQLSAAASAVGSIHAHVSVSIEASASVGGACGASSGG